MMRPRVIPCLLLKDSGLVKTTRFERPVYLGDPINIVRLFNDKGADELIFLDISAPEKKRGPQLELLGRIAREAFMPIAYGGGVATLDDIDAILSTGFEKVAINTQAFESPGLVSSAAARFGSQSVIVSIDVEKSWLRRTVRVSGGRVDTGMEPVAYARRMQELGAGELLVNSVERDGTMSGYDLDLLRDISSSVTIPVIGCGGAGRLDDLGKAIREGGCSAAAAGSLFVFQGIHRAVLISYPEDRELDEVFGARHGLAEADGAKVEDARVALSR